jgi:hypothetical protein
VAPWIDPDETDRETWAGSSEHRPATKTVYERATDTVTPYEREDDVYVHGPDVAEEFHAADYTHARLHFHVAVDVQDRTKVLVKGHLWGDDEVHHRFRTQYRRAGEPTETAPFDEYRVWQRTQRGTVSRDGDGIAFEPDDGSTRERTMTLDWPALYSSDQLRIAEAELVRNPPLARYVLAEQDLWEEVRDAFRYNPEAFDRSP